MRVSGISGTDSVFTRWLAVAKRVERHKITGLQVLQRIGGQRPAGARDSKALAGKRPIRTARSTDLRA